MKFFIAVAFAFSPVTSYAATVYFPQIADGGGYKTILTVFNSGMSSVSGRLRFFTPNGLPWQISINSTVDSQIPISLPPSGSARFVTSGTGTQLTTGWASLEALGVLNGVATFEFRSDGKLTEAVGTLGAGAVRRFMIPAEYGSGGFEDVGVAIVNTSASNRLMVKLSLLDESGNVADRRNKSPVLA